MPGPLIKHKEDPQGLGRGPGEYWHRGKGQYSKYSMARDMMRISKIRKYPAKNAKYRRRYRHLEDTKLVMRGGKVIGAI